MLEHILQLQLRPGRHTEERVDDLDVPHGLGLAQELLKRWLARLGPMPAVAAPETVGDDRLGPAAVRDPAEPGLDDDERHCG